MKKIKLIFALLAITALNFSCENDGGDSKVALGVGAVPNIVKITTTDSFIDLADVNNGTPIDLGLTVDVAQGDVASMDIIAFYQRGTTVYRAVLETDVVTFPATFHITQTDIIDAFAEINSAADFAIGDSFTVTAELTLKNGTVIKILNDNGTRSYGQDIANSNVYKVTQVFNVACESDLAGTYSVLSSGTSTDSGPTPDENPITNHPYTVTITANGGGSYTMSDGYGGLYLLWYDIYGVTGDYPGSFSDVCGVLSGSYAEPFGTTVTLTGTVNPDGTLSIHWVNGYDDFGDSVFTRN